MEPYVSVPVLSITVYFFSLELPVLTFILMSFWTLLFFWWHYIFLWLRNLVTKERCSTWILYFAICFIFRIC